ncbi:MAG: carboxypeptidase regulatory-like domain-containing protein [Myxococcota bacterium]
MLFSLVSGAVGLAMVSCGTSKNDTSGDGLAGWTGDSAVDSKPLPEPAKPLPEPTTGAQATPGDRDSDPMQIIYETRAGHEAGAETPLTAGEGDDALFSAEDSETESASYSEGAATLAGSSGDQAACSIGTNGGYNYCTDECPCDPDEGDCDGDSQCAPGLYCARDIGGLYGWNADVDVCVSGCLAPGPHTDGTEDFCSEECPCESGQGDCDNRNQCAGDLVCAFDLGADFGFDPETDVCLSPCDDRLNGHYDHCGPECPCPSGEGDCDTSADCEGNLVCAQDLGADFGLDPTTDVCLSPCDDRLNGHFEHCQPECPCDAGEADCDVHADCAPGLRCGYDLGAEFGFEPDDDVCIDPCDPLMNGTYDHCSPSCPCPAGEGDCDSDADCAPGTICVNNAGPNYGFPADMDVCENPPVFIQFAGQVLDSFGEPVGGAAVSVNGVAVTTGGNGTFAITVEEVDRYVINAERLGFVPSSRVHAGAAIDDMVIALQEAQVFEIDPTQPVSVVDDSGTQIDLPAGALVDASGNPPVGPISMSVHTFDVVDGGMVGNMEAMDTTGAPVILESVGAISVDFSDQAGTKFDLAGGSSATITVAVPPEISYAGAIPMWHYDMETGQWVEEGMGMVVDGVATATVAHFSTWNFDVKRDDPACVRVDVLPPLAGPGQSLQARVKVGGAFPTTRVVDLSAGRNALFNLPPNTDITMYIPPAAPTPFQVINTGAAWGGSGVPPAPYDACNAMVTLSGSIPGTATGAARLDYRNSAVGTTAELMPAGGGAAITTAVADDRGRYALTIDSGTYSVALSSPGYLPVEIPEVYVRDGKVTYQPCVKLRAGDVNGDNVIDGADEALVVTQLNTAVGQGDPADFNSDLFIDDSDLEAVVANQGMTGPLTPGDGLSGCFDNLVLESEPNEDGTPQTGGNTTNGGDFSTVNANGPYSGTTLIEAEFNPAGDEDVFAVTNTGAVAKLLEIETYNRNLGYGEPCNTSVDTVINVRNAAGNSLAYNDDNSGYCSFTTYTIAPGDTVYVHITEYGDNNGGSSYGYYLEIRFPN